MRIAALVPTRNRADTAHRAAGSLLDALQTIGAATSTQLLIVDNSDAKREIDKIRVAADSLRSAHPRVKIEILTSTDTGSSDFSVETPLWGPGNVRNLGFKHLATELVHNDITLLFDDDVCFGDVEYLGTSLLCDGANLLREAFKLCQIPKRVVGCSYAGRQDLSILEHIVLSSAEKLPEVRPATDRSAIQSVAPAGISTAFLAISSPVHMLPNFPHHYNEDYVWLHTLDRAGWELQRASTLLPHVPPGGIKITAPLLSFQVFGEIVWLAISERARLDYQDPKALAAAVDEVIDDIRAALIVAESRLSKNVIAMLRQIKTRYEALRDDVAAARPCLLGARLKEAIEAGLSLRPISS
jgi:hypothetical protein